MYCHLCILLILQGTLPSQPFTKQQYEHLKKQGNFGKLSYDVVQRQVGRDRLVFSKMAAPQDRNKVLLLLLWDRVLCCVRDEITTDYLRFIYNLSDTKIADLRGTVSGMEQSGELTLNEHGNVLYRQDHDSPNSTPSEVSKIIRTVFLMYVRAIYLHCLHVLLFRCVRASMRMCVLMVVRVCICLCLCLSHVLLFLNNRKRCTLLTTNVSSTSSSSSSSSSSLLSDYFFLIQAYPSGTRKPWGCGSDAHLH